MTQWRVHPSWWVIVLMLGITFGVGMAFFVGFELPWLILAILTVVLMVMVRVTYNTVWPLVFWVIIGVLLGWCYATPIRQQLQIYDNLTNKAVVLSGRLLDDVAKTTSGAHVYRLDQIEIYQQKLPGEILVISRQINMAKRGDRLEISGVLSEGLAGYRAVFKNAQLGRVFGRSSLGLEMRNFFTDNLDRQLSPLQASLASAFLTGKRRELPADFALNLQIAGLTHLVVASGFHLTTVVRSGKRLGERRSRRWALALGLLVIGAFTLITGLSSSMTRAGLVSLISLIGWYYGRRGGAGRILVLSLGLTILVNPLYLWGHASFYLSFGAFAGVLLIGPTLRQYFWGQKRLRFLPQLLTEAVSAQLATLPISIFFFGKLSMVMLITNLLIVPAMPLVMLFSLLVSLFGALPGIGVILVWPLQLILNYIIMVTNWFASLPLARVDLTINLGQVILAYLVIISIVGYMAWRNHRDIKLTDVSRVFNVVE